MNMSDSNNGMIFIGLFMLISIVVGAIAGIPAIISADNHIQDVRANNYQFYDPIVLNGTVDQTITTGIPLMSIIGAIVLFSSIGILYMMFKRANKFVRVR